MKTDMGAGTDSDPLTISQMAAVKKLRICATDGCSTRLSSYNPRKRCHFHWKIKFPQTRNRLA